MRWHTASHETSAEAAEREDALRRIDQWWKAFRSSARQIDEFFSVRNAHPDFDLAGWMHESLGHVDPRLMWEYGPAVAGKRHRLVITPESSRHLRPLVDQILVRAPDCGFEFYGTRLPETLQAAIEAARSRTGSEIVVSGIECKRGSGHRVDLSVTAAADANDRQLDLAWSQAIILCSTWLGEAITDRWLGVVDVVAGAAPAPPLAALKTRFESAVASGRQARQPLRYSQAAAESEWTLLRMEPVPDHAITRRSDLFVYRTMDMEFFKTVRHRLPFYSERFSAHGERFCYLMLDGKDAEMEGFKDKSEIEDALDAALLPRGLGAVIGSGTGTRYSYIDLAIADVETSCNAITEVLRAGRIVRNAWILFHDDEWHDEWIGVHADTPLPPAADSSD